jgi:hypothetical protein
MHLPPRSGVGSSNGKSTTLWRSEMAIENPTHERFHELCAEVEEYQTLPEPEPAADMFRVAPVEERYVWMDEDSIRALLNPWHAADFS